MKRFTTIICCVALMIAAVAMVFTDNNIQSNKTITAATIQRSFTFDDLNGLPLDVQLDLNKRLSHESSSEPVVKDSINIIDSVRWVTKVRWKTKYRKNVAACTTARETGKHLTPAIPDSMPSKPVIISTLGREEKPNESVGTTRVPSIQLSVDGKVVYSTSDNHSTGESR